MNELETKFEELNELTSKLLTYICILNSAMNRGDTDLDMGFAGDFVYEIHEQIIEIRKLF